MKRLAARRTSRAHTYDATLDDSMDLTSRTSGDPYLSSWELQATQISLLREIGRGSFGVVRLARWRSTPVAVKILLNTRDFQNRQIYHPEEFVRELSTMRALHHPNVVQFLGFVRLPEPAIVMEYFPNRSLEDYMKKTKWLRYSTARRLAEEVSGKAVGRPTQQWTRQP